MVNKAAFNEVDESDVPPDALGKFQTAWQTWLENSIARSLPSKTGEQSPPMNIRVFILEGFFLYPGDPETGINDALHMQLYKLTRATLDMRLFLLASKDQVIMRRAQRMSCMTLKDFPTDPPGYVEHVVWPNYQREHSWMFINGDVAGMVIDQNRVRDQAVMVCPGKGQSNMGNILMWALERIVDMLSTGFQEDFRKKPQQQS